MALFEWSDEYEMKIPSIDKQHKAIADAISSVYDFFIAGNIEECKNAIDHLIKNVEAHTHYEEDLFEMYDYKCKDLQKEEHQLFLQRLEIFKKSYTGSESSIQEDEILYFKWWLTNHMLSVDKKYSDFLIEKGIN